MADNKDAEEALEFDKIKILTNILNLYKWIADSYMLDFFTCSNYSKLLKCWQNFFQTTSLENLGNFLDFDKILLTQEPWPLSLLTIRVICSKLTLCRRPKHVCYSSQNYHENQCKPAKSACFVHARLKNIFLKHVKPKKRYEIEKMAAKTADLAQKTKVRVVIDVGSGVGHLCRTLAYGYGLNVVGIEAQENLTFRAHRLDKELEVTASKHLSAGEMEQILKYRPVHKKGIIDFATTADDLIRMVSDSSSDADDGDFGLVGLHPCGNLAAVLIKLFVACPRVKFINIIGCCYHKMTLRGAENRGYPISKHLSGCAELISPEAAGLACHAVEVCSERLSRGDYQHLKIHAFRAALERIICRRWPEHARAGLNNVRHYPLLTFSEYCEKALLKLGVTVPAEDFSLKDTLSDLSQWKEAVFFHFLGQMLGPAIETLILWDRLFYLIEHDIPCQLQAAFDPKISPRNHILSAIKPS